MLANKSVRILIALLAVAIFGYFTALSFKDRNLLAVELLIAPSTATVEIDGKVVKDKKIDLNPGEHNLKATLENFSSKDEKFTVSEGQDNTVRVLLDPANDKGEAYLQSRPDLQREREGIASEEVNTKSIAAADKYPFLGRLPLERQRFTVNYGDAILTKGTDPNEPYVALYVTTADNDGSARRNAIRTISEDLSLGPADIEIIFEGYRNPFDKAVDGE